jgi:hypothetical protein
VMGMRTPLRLLNYCYLLLPKHISDDLTGGKKFPLFLASESSRELHIRGQKVY